MKTIELSNSKVEIIDELTWGMQEQIRGAILSGMSVGNLNDADRQDMRLEGSVLGPVKFKVLELCVKKVIEADGKEHGYTKAWMEGLSISDGDKVWEAVDEVSNPKKK